MADPRVKVAAVAEIPPGEGRVFEVNGRTLALFNVDGRFYATDLAPGGPLGEGELDGAVIRCTLARVALDVTTGATSTTAW